ncbi:MAG: Alpha amylase [Paenibacillaceae bacterium]|nr:Alpha amylase [Paenibacillaceae bacterium]
MGQDIAHGHLYLRETERLLVFGSDKTELRFAADSGELDSVYWNGVRIADSALQEELFMDIGGVMESSIDTEHKNDKYPSIRCANSLRLGIKGIMLGYKAKKPMDGLELSIDVQQGDFVIRKIYHLSSESAVSRRFEVTYNGEAETSLQYLYVTTLGIAAQENGLAVVEAPLHSFPEGLRLAGAADHTLDFQCSPYIFSNNAILLHNEANTWTMTIWSGNLRQQMNEIHFSHWANQCAVVQKFHVNAFMKRGDCICTGDSRFQLAEAPWEVCLTELTLWHERNGQRCKPTNAELLKKTVMLETQIGPVEFPPSVKHEAYSNVDQLIESLPEIRATGFNTLCLMPGFPYPGYTIFDLKQPEIQHNTAGRLKELVDKAHELGMKVVLDIVMHGCQDKEIADWNTARYSIRKAFFSNWQQHEPVVSPLREEHPEWFIYQDNGEIFRKYTWLFDLAHPGFQQYFAEALQLSVARYGVDGFRFDAPYWAEAPNRREGLPYLPSKALTYGVWELFCKARKMVDPMKPDLIWLNEWEGMMWRDVTDIAYSYSSYYKWEKMFYEEISGVHMQRFYEIRKKAMPEHALFVNFSDNHDTWFLGEKGLFSYDKFTPAYSRIMLVMNLFAEGAFMSYAGFEEREKEFFRKVLHIRNSQEIFSKGRCDYGRVTCEHEHVFSICWEYEEQLFIICSNVSAECLTGGLRIKPAHDRKFINHLQDEGERGLNQISFAPFEVKILQAI